MVCHIQGGKIKGCCDQKPLLNSIHGHINKLNTALQSALHCICPEIHLFLAQIKDHTKKIQ